MIKGFKSHYILDWDDEIAPAHYIAWSIGFCVVGDSRDIRFHPEATHLSLNPVHRRLPLAEASCNDVLETIFDD